MTAPEPAPWYGDGLRFQCTTCADCCGGEPGAVWLNHAELQAIAEELSLTVAQTVQRHVRRQGERLSLREHANGDCVLLDPHSRRCSVYEARPVQCRSWPFWSENIETPAAWARTCEECPGSGQGDIVPLARIREQVKALRVARRRR